MSVFVAYRCVWAASLRGTVTKVPQAVERDGPRRDQGLQGHQLVDQGVRRQRVQGGDPQRLLHHNVLGHILSVQGVQSPQVDGEQARFLWHVVDLQVRLKEKRNSQWRLQERHPLRAGEGTATNLLAHECGLEVVVVLQVEGPQEGDRFPCGYVGHKLPIVSHRDGRAAAPDGQVPHQFHHLHLQVASLEADLRG